MEEDTRPKHTFTGELRSLREEAADPPPLSKEERNEQTLLEVHVLQVERLQSSLKLSEAKFKNTIDHLENGVALINEDGITIAWNQAIARITGLPAEEALGEKWWDIQVKLTPENERIPKLRDRIKANIVEAQVTGKSIWLKNTTYDEYIGQDGVRRFINTQRFKFKHEDNYILGIIMNDITHLKRAEVAEEATRQMADERAFVIHDALNREQKLHEVTRILTSRLEIDYILENVIQLAAELVDADTSDLGLISSDGQNLVFPYVYAPKNQKPIDELTQLIPRGEGLAWEIVESQKSVLIQVNDLENKAHQIMAESGISSLMMAPILAGGKCLGVLGLFSLTPRKLFSDRDLAVTETIARQAGVALQNARLFEEVQQLAITDPLTGLYNRRHFFALAEREFDRSSRYERPLSAIMLDIDFFKNVNDTHGHSIGDEVLESLAEKLSLSIRSTDIIGRYGGEEFVILMPETEITNAHSVGERLCRLVANSPISTSIGPVKITISLGVSGFTSAHIVPLDELLVLADKALYEAKNSGRNRVRVWQQENLEEDSSTNSA